jgi:hypothetical protein
MPFRQQLIGEEPDWFCEQHWAEEQIGAVHQQRLSESRRHQSKEDDDMNSQVSMRLHYESNDY